MKRTSQTFKIRGVKPCLHLHSIFLPAYFLWCSENSTLGVLGKEFIFSNRKRTLMKWRGNDLCLKVEKWRWILISIICMYYYTLHMLYFICPIITESFVKNIVSEILTHFSFQYNINYFFPIIYIINTTFITPNSIYFTLHLW